MKKISVIVPIYNSESYLNRCIDSILLQTYKNLEVILIDDGSTDSSRNICDDYKKRDKRIQVIHKNNGGQSSARNMGIDIATGRYIAFVDSDDWLVNDIYDYCIDLAEETDSDVVDFKIVYTDGEVKRYSQKNSKVKLIEGKEILRDYLAGGQTDRAPFSPCRKLYKRELFKNIRFPEGKINEDIATNYKLLMESDRIIKTEKIGYHYFQNSTSTTRNGLRKRDFDLLDASMELVMLTDNEEYREIKYLAKIKHARSYFSLLAKIAFFGIEDEKLDKKDVIRELTSKLRENYCLLMKSPMPINRKLMVTAICINIRCLSIPLYVYRQILRK